MRDDAIHMTQREIESALARIDALDAGEERTRNMTRLAWRPAWAIRSRKGALAALFAMFRTPK